MTTEPNTQPRTWAITPYDGRGKKTGDPVYVKATTREGAERTGRELLTMFDVKYKQVGVSAWSPETDHQLASYCRRTKSEVLPATSEDWDAWRDGRLG